MERMLYLVAPTSDQLDWDEDGPVSRDLFVWAKDPSEAIKLWRTYYDLDDEGTITESEVGTEVLVRVFEIPMMQSTSPSTAIPWNDVRYYAATTSTYSETS